MSTTNRPEIFKKIHKVLKKHYKPNPPVSDRTVLEQLLYACCLEDVPVEKADEGFARLQQGYYDWNEIRVTTVRELAEHLSGLTDPTTAAQHLKRTLQSVFESLYSFDLEHLRKENIGKAVKTMEKLGGTTPFTVAYVTQNALGGHSIPLSKAALHLMFIVGAIDEKEFEKKTVPGLERAIPKNTGVEFGSLLQQLAADFTASPHSPRLRTVLLEIAPDAKDRMPKRRSKKQAALNENGKSSQPSEQPTTAKKKTGKGKAAEGAQTPAPEPKKAPRTEKKTPVKEPKKPASTKKETTSGTTGKKKTVAKKPSTSKQLARRKPR